MKSLIIVALVLFSASFVTPANRVFADDVEAKEVTLEGKFAERGDDRMVFVVAGDEKIVYGVFKSQHEAAKPHLGKQIKLVAKVKPTKMEGKSAIVKILSISPVEED